MSLANSKLTNTGHYHGQITEQVFNSHRADFILVAALGLYTEYIQAQCYQTLCHILRSRLECTLLPHISCTHFHYSN